MVARLRPALAAATVVVAALVALPSAASAFAPKLDVAVDAARPSQTAKFSFVITQAPADPASRHILIAIPSGFTTTTPLSALAVCGWPEELSRECSEASRIGSVEDLETVPGGTLPLNGGIYWGGELRTGLYKLIVFLDNVGFDLHPQFEAQLQARPKGGFDLTFDDLPQTPSQRFGIFLDGGKRAVLATPAVCGDYRFDGSFISRGEERASSSATIPIRGCADIPLQVTNVGMNRATVKRHSRARVHFTLNRSARVRMIVHNAKGKTVQDRHVIMARGQRTLSLGRDLHRGDYRIGLFFTTASNGHFEQKLALKVR
jgi:hypothetical protein